MDYEKTPLLATPEGSLIQGGEIEEVKPKKTCGLQIQLSPKVILYFSLLVVTGIANNVAGRWNQEKFGVNYAFFNGQVRDLTTNYPKNIFKNIPCSFTSLIMPFWHKSCLHTNTSAPRISPLK